LRASASERAMVGVRRAYFTASAKALDLIDNVNSSRTLLCEAEQRSKQE